MALFNFLWRLLLSLFDMLKDLFYWIFDTILGFFTDVLNGLGDLFNGLDVLQYVNALPSDISAFLSAIAFGQALGMITTALIIRLTINLIPFIRI